MEEFKFNTVEEAIAAIKAGKMVLVTDDEDRENEGDLIMAAELCTPEAVNFMAKYARGLICMPAAPEIMDKLQCGAMVAKKNVLMITRSLMISVVRDMFFRCVHVKAAYCAAQGTPRRL